MCVGMFAESRGGAPAWPRSKSINTPSPGGRLKTRDWKTRDWKTRHQTAGVENAGLENAGV